MDLTAVVPFCTALGAISSISCSFSGSTVSAKFVFPFNDINNADSLIMFQVNNVRNPSNTCDGDPFTNIAFYVYDTTS
jgi:hypothetical protein